MFKVSALKCWLMFWVVCAIAGLFALLLVPREGFAGQGDGRRMAKAVTVTSAAGSQSWDSEADFGGGGFEQTTVPAGVGSVMVAHRWTTNAKVNDDLSTGRQEKPMLIVDHNGTLYAIWEDDRYQDFDFNIYVSRSLDGGSSWLTNRIVVNESSFRIRENPVLAVDQNGVLYAAWQSRRYRSDDYDIYVARSSDGGNSWSEKVKVNDDDGSTAQHDPSLAVDANGTVMVTWEDHRHNNSDIYAATSTDGGQSWSANVQVNQDSDLGAEHDPTLVVDANGVFYVVWWEQRSDTAIYLARSRDKGVTWQAHGLVNDEGVAVGQYNPSLAVDTNGHLYVVWEDSRHGYSDIYFSRSTDEGDSWGADVKVNQDTGWPYQYYPTVGVDANGRVIVAWQDERHGNDQDDIYVASSANGGQQWSAHTQVNDGDDTNNQHSPSLAVGPNQNVYLTWQDERDGHWDIYAARWSDNAYYNEGSYTMDYDAGEIVAWDRLTLAANLPANTLITLTVRVGNTETPDRHWSEWYTLSSESADLSHLPPSRYLQWRANFTTSPSGITPSLDTVTLAWDEYTYTTVSGGYLANETIWGDSSPVYIITGNLLLDPDATLTIRPGTTLRFNQNRVLKVKGSLIAQGSATQPITFTSWYANPQPGDWQNILFDDESTDAVFDSEGQYVRGSILQYAIVEYAGARGASYAVEAANSRPFIDHSTIRYNEAGGVRVGNTLITHNTITENEGTGLYYTTDYQNNEDNEDNESYPAPRAPSENDLLDSYSEERVLSHKNTHEQNEETTSIAYNMISDNASNPAHEGVGGIYNSASNVMIHNNTISGHSNSSYGGGIYNYDSSNVTIHSNTIFDNRVSSRGSAGGILNHYSTNIMIRDNIISSNQATSRYSGGAIFNSYCWNVRIHDNTIEDNQALSWRSGGGIANHASDSVQIYNNAIKRNATSGEDSGSAIYWRGSFYDDYDNILAHNTISHNTISGDSQTGGIHLDQGDLSLHGNTIENNDGYQLYNKNLAGYPTLDARSNWWGTSDEEQIKQAIFDWIDDSEHAMVDYRPFLSQPATAPTLSVTSQSLSFTTERYVVPPEQTLTIDINSTSTDSIFTSWHASDDADWLRLSDYRGLIDDSGTAELRVSVRSYYYDEGIYTGTITINAPGALNNPQLVNVILTIEDDYTGISPTPWATTIATTIPDSSPTPLPAVPATAVTATAAPNTSPTPWTTPTVTTAPPTAEPESTSESMPTAAASDNLNEVLFLPILTR